MNGFKLLNIIFSGCLGHVKDNGKIKNTRIQKNLMFCFYKHIFIINGNMRTHAVIHNAFSVWYFSQHCHIQKVSHIGQKH